LRGWAERAVTAHNATITALPRHAAVMGATAAGSLKDAGQFVRLGCGGALVGDDGLGGGCVVGKGRSREEKEEESGGESFHGGLPDKIFVSITSDEFNLASG